MDPAFQQYPSPYLQILSLETPDHAGATNSIATVHQAPEFGIPLPAPSNSLSLNTPGYEGAVTSSPAVHHEPGFGIPIPGPSKSVSLDTPPSI